MLPSMTCTCGAITVGFAAGGAGASGAGAASAAAAAFFLPKSGIGRLFAFFNTRVLASFTRSSALF